MIGNIRLTETFKEFVENERSAGIMLIICSAISLLIANSVFSEIYLGFWKTDVGGMTVFYWINDGLMAIFFLLISLELKREFYKGELSDLRSALLPLFAALGGIIIPSSFHFGFNAGTPTQAGIGIPMATDIAFAVTILALAGNRVPLSLKIFLTAVAVIDDLGAIIVIAVFYTYKLSIFYLLLSLGVYFVLSIFNRAKIYSLLPYMLGGILMWVFILQSGVHATIAGVLLALTIPFTAIRDDKRSPSYKLEKFLYKPVAFFILPVFALANAGIIINMDRAASLTSTNSLGIVAGLLFGKVLGVTALSFIAVKMGICRLPLALNWKHIIGAGFLAGIGFTMSIFIANLAFKENAELIHNSILAVLLTSLISGFIGYVWLMIFGTENAENNQDDQL